MTKREYNKIHKWNLRNWQKTGQCEACKKQVKTHWSNKSGKYIRFDKSDWQELCPKCHRQYDIKYLGLATDFAKKPWLQKKHKAKWYALFIKDILRLAQ